MRLPLDLDDYVCADIETDGLTGDTIWCVGFTDLCGTIVLEWGEAQEHLQRLLDDPYKILVFHNAAFDVRVLRRHGINIPPNRYACSMVAAHSVNPQRKQHSLESYGVDLGEEKIDYGAAMREAGLWDGKDEAELYRVPYNPVMDTYCGQDTYVDWLLWGDILQHFARDERMFGSYCDVHLPMVEVTMQLNGGMHIDYPATIRLASTLIAEIQADEEVILKRYPLVTKLSWKKDIQQYVVATTRKGEVIRHPPNLGSPNDVHSLLLANGWQPDDFKPDTGRPVSSQAALRRVIATPDTPPQLVECCRLITEYKSKVGIQQQLMQLLTLADMKTGMLRGNWHQTGTETHRYSSSAPNLQNFSTRHPVLGKQVRSLFTPPPGMVMLIADLSQAELAILAYYLELLCQDSEMAAGFRAGLDAHTNNTKNWYGVDENDPAFKLYRARAKNGAFAAGYGAAARRLSLTLNISIAEAMEILETVSTKTEINRLKELVWKQLGVERDIKPVRHGNRSYKRGFMYTLHGTRNFYPGYIGGDRKLKAHAERKSFNSLMQTGCFEVFAIMCVRILPYIPSGGWISNLTHDEAHVFVPAGTEAQAKEDFNKAWSGYVMQTPQGGVPLGGEWEICKSWADK